MTRKDKFVTNFVTAARRLSVDCFVTGKEGASGGRGTGGRVGGVAAMGGDTPGPCFIHARYLYLGPVNEPQEN